jgi:hypothetical protein
MPTLKEGVDYTQNNAGQYVFPARNPEEPAWLVQISYTTISAAYWQSALQELGLSLATGALGQPVWSWLQAYAPSQALGYSGMGSVYAQDYPLTNQAELENHSFEVVTGHAVNASVLDAWPSVVLKDFLVTHDAGVGWLAPRLGTLAQFDSYTKARQLWLSVAMKEQKPAREWLQGLAQICNSEWIWQGGVLDLVPRGDEAIASGYTQRHARV